jgi:hypothetical protein
VSLATARRKLQAAREFAKGELRHEAFIRSVTCSDPRTGNSNVVVEWLLSISGEKPMDGAAVAIGGLFLAAIVARYPSTVWWAAISAIAAVALDEEVKPA